MSAFLKKVKKLDFDELVAISEAIDLELERRSERFDDVPESARRRAIERSHSYRRKNGAAALPIAVAGLRSNSGKRRAA